MEDKIQVSCLKRHDTTKNLYISGDFGFKISPLIMLDDATIARQVQFYFNPEVPQCLNAPYNEEDTIIEMWAEKLKQDFIKVFKEKIPL
ncbi:MAG: hypothetical protein PHI86_05715 [Candidatus Omnitrophica bacterium]|jgi:hypothetical protein|nr:hypothetical protein [Candidatus Omnitrophota bacterium]